MLNTLDTVIAFAVIMTVLSLLITIVVQMVSAALSMRGKNLANALALTFQTIDPKIGEHAHSLAAQILRDPIFSDSILRTKNRDEVAPDANTQELINAEKDLKNAQQELAADSRSTDKNAAVINAKLKVAAAKISFVQERLKKAQQGASSDSENLAAKKSKLEKAKTAITNAQEKLRAAEQQLTADLESAERQKAVKDAEAELDRAMANVQIRDVRSNRMKPWSTFSIFKLWDATALGSAIRPGEVYRLLHEFADLTETGAALRDIPPDLVEKSVAVLACLKDRDQPAQESEDKLKAIKEVADIFVTEQQKKAVLDSLANFGATVERATTQAYDRFQRWFGSAQDRAEQWFQMHVRILTICASVAIAFLLQLDTGTIFRQLRDQPNLVEVLVKSAPGVLEKGGEIVEPSDTPAYHAYLLWLRDHPLFPLDNLPTPAVPERYAHALEKRLGESPNSAWPLNEFSKAYDTASKVEGATELTPEAVAKSAYESWVEKFPKYELPADYDFTKATKDSISKEISNLVAKDPDNKPNTQTLLQEYANLQTQGVYAYERARQKTFSDLQKKLDEAGFDIVPERFLGRWDKDPTPRWAHRFHLPRLVAVFMAHLLGILATAGLLALGAPFWFNLLKNLTSLRPALATLIEKRPTSAPALPPAPTTPPSPS